MRKSDREPVRRQVFLQQLAIFVSLTLCGSLIAFMAAVIHVSTFLSSPPFGVDEFDASLDGLGSTLSAWAGLSVGGVVAAAVSTVVNWRLTRKAEVTTSRETLIAAVSGPLTALPFGLVLMMSLLWWGVLVSVSLTIAGAAVFFGLLTLFGRTVARTTPSLADVANESIAD